MPNPPMTRARMKTATFGAKGTDRAEEIKKADPEQGGFASKAICGPTTEKRTYDSAVERGSHGNTVQSGTMSPEGLNGFFGAGNNDCVKTEEKSGKRR